MSETARKPSLTDRIRSRPVRIPLVISIEFVITLGIFLVTRYTGQAEPLTAQPEFLASLGILVVLIQLELAYEIILFHRERDEALSHVAETIEELPTRFELAEYFPSRSMGLLKVRELIRGAREEVLTIWSTGNYSSYPDQYFNDEFRSAKRHKRIINIASVPLDSIATHLLESQEHFNTNYQVHLMIEAQHELAVVDHQSAVLFFPAGLDDESFLQIIRNESQVQNLARRFNDMWERSAEFYSVERSDIVADRDKLVAWLTRIRRDLERKRTTRVTNLVLSEYFTSASEGLKSIEQLTNGAKEYVHSIWTVGDEKALRNYFETVTLGETTTFDRVVDIRNVVRADVLTHIRNNWGSLRDGRYHLRLLGDATIRVGVIIADQHAALWVNSAGPGGVWILNVIDDRFVVDRLHAYWNELRDRATLFRWEGFVARRDGDTMDEAAVSDWLTTQYAAAQRNSRWGNELT